MSQSCRDRPRARTQAPNDRKGNDCGQRCYFGRAARAEVKVELERQFGPRKRVRLKGRIVSVPSRSRAEEAVQRLGLLQVHRFPAPGRHEIANGEIEADEHHERDKPLIALGRTVRDDKHAEVVEVRRASPQEGANF
jgi:hypothetical protein